MIKGEKMSNPKIPPNDNLPHAKYVVRPGDNLTIISQATGIPIAVLAQDNKSTIKDPNVLRVGQAIDLRYHPDDSETINSPEMRAMFSSIWDQMNYLKHQDTYTQMRYDMVVREGAQAYFKKQ